MAVSNLLVTDWFKTNYPSLWPNTSITHKVSVKLYNRTPVFTDNSASAFASVTTLSELTSDYPEWVPANASCVSHTSESIAADLYLKKVSGTDKEYLQLGAGGTWGAVNVDTDGGFYLTATSPVTEVQEIISAAVFYIVGSVTGVDGVSVTDPILFATKQGIGEYVIAHDGSVYGQTSYAFSSASDTFTISLDTAGFGSSLNITHRSRTDDVATITLDADHTLVVGDVITVAGTGASTFNTTAIVTAITSNTVSYSSTGSNVSTTVSSGTVTLQSSKFSSGYTLLKLSPPKWEPAHAYHLWLEPQRVNLIANPSFEDSTDYWRCSVTDGASVTLDRYENSLNSNRPYTGYMHKASPGSGTIVLESNLFPKVSPWASVSFTISGSGTFRYGLMIYPSDYQNPVYIQSDDIVIDGGTGDSGFQKFSALVPVPDDVYEAQFRVEFEGDEFWIDDVLVDPHESQYEYFDGNSNTSLADDFRWMGGYSNAHFSLWYNNFKNTSSRIVGSVDDSGNFIPGLTNEWIPNGATVITHWNAVTPITPANWDGDAFYPISNFPAGAVCSDPNDRLSFLLVVIP